MVINLMKRLRDSKNASFDFIAPFSLSACEERIRNELPPELRAWGFGKYTSRVDVQTNDEQHVKGFSAQLNIGSIGGHITATGFLKNETDTSTFVDGHIIVSDWTKLVFFTPAIVLGSIFLVSFLVTLHIRDIGISLFFVLGFLGAYCDITSRCRNALISSIKESLHSFF